MRYGPRTEAHRRQLPPQRLGVVVQGRRRRLRARNVQRPQALAQGADVKEISVIHLADENRSGECGEVLTRDNV